METKEGCKHYQRSCEILTPCCNLFYVCHLCHDELYKGVKGPGCLTERLDRTQIKTIRCKTCSKPQESSEKCKFCEQIFAKYYCSFCNLFENSDKNIYHCAGCGICRIGKSAEYFHCDKCKVCYPLTLQSNHKCNDDSLNQNCPICLENLFYSREESLKLKCCGNWIHVNCYYKYVKKFMNCPFCSKSLFLMKKEDIETMDKIIEETRGELPEEFKEKKVSIFCNDCLGKTENMAYHPMGMKCGKCESYNTKM